MGGEGALYLGAAVDDAPSGIGVEERQRRTQQRVQHLLMQCSARLQGRGLEYGLKRRHKQDLQHTPTQLRPSAHEMLLRWNNKMWASPVRVEGIVTWHAGVSFTSFVQIFPC